MKKSGFSCLIALHIPDEDLQAPSNWKQLLDPASNDGVRTTSLAKDRFEVCFRSSQLLYETILKWLSSRSEVIYVYVVPVREKLNNYADKIIEVCRHFLIMKTYLNLIQYGSSYSDQAPRFLSVLTGAGQVEIIMPKVATE